MKALALSFALFVGLAVAADASSLTVAGLSGEPIKLELADVQKLKAREVDVPDPHAKQTSHYRAVPLAELLSKVGAPLGESHKGKMLTAVVVIDAEDGYRVVFSLPELDAGTGNTEAFLAFELDGKPLAGELGTFRLVVPTDKRGARWVRQVTRISVVEIARP